MKSIWRKFRGMLGQKGFLAAMLVLAVAALGLNAVTRELQLHFQKQAVPPARELSQIPTVLGHWHQVSLDEPLDPTVEESLGSKQYIIREYLDERVVGMKAIEDFKEKSSDQRRKMIDQMLAQNPEAVMSLQTIYYTGLVDTVAHIPERCFIADGYEPESEPQTLTWQIGPDQRSVRFITFVDQTGRGGVTKNVAYFFNVNGTYKSSSLDVRLRLQDLREKYGYYCKVEIMTVLRDPEESARIMTDFLTAAMPEISKCFPDWAALTQRP